MASTGYTLAHPADLDGETSYTFTCGKIDAGIAVLIGSHAHLIEFPSLLLPPGCEPGSIVSITCTRDNAAEKAQADSFWDLQTKIADQFGVQSPQAPKLRLRSITQTSVTLEWDKLELAQCKLLSLSIWKNGQRLGTLPNPLTNTSTKLSGLDLDSEYTFNLVMKTTGGSFNSQHIKVKTHSLNDTSGINVCFGVILPEEIKEQSKEAIQQLDGRWSDKIQIDTTHFVCTMAYQAQQASNRASQPSTFPSLEYQRALQLSIPVVQPSWLQACLHERKMVPIAAHYLGAQPPPLSSSPTNTTGGRPRSASKPHINSSTPISPTNNNEINSSSTGTSTSGQHERANSAPASATISDSGKPQDQSSAGLAVIIESKDSDTITSQHANDHTERTAYNPDQSSSARHSRSNTTTESDSAQTFKLSTSDQYTHHQPHMPTPPRLSTGLSDILKENVDSPAENDGSPSPNKPIELPSSTIDKTSAETTTNGINKSIKEGEDDAISTHPSTSSPPKQMTRRTSEFTDQSLANHQEVVNGEDDPFSAASPTISNPSPLGDRPSFSSSNSLNHHHLHQQLGGLLTPTNNIPSSSVDSSNVDNDLSETLVIPDQPFEKDNHEVDQEDSVSEINSITYSTKTLKPDPPAFSPIPLETDIENNSQLKTGGSEIFDEISISSDHHFNQINAVDDHRNLVDNEEEDVIDSKVDSGSGDTFFSSASIPDHSDPTLSQNIDNIDTHIVTNNHLENLLDFHPVVDPDNHTHLSSSQQDSPGHLTL
ncbi:hypothetical protein MJO28_008901 [Puccinia striiformis f. sp. tritici]|uniref:Uncharacterized protein n=1 Tax=Puccinia striiformis f. sp. tritici TaxID=168172 RepID=A0ACC0EF66_9BASI|nr:hypothetical protein Pst134EA_015057 [Puccinia striiformis f. sp. tritici]KAH9462969.1 hypothetical protein Pst134EA_015057 [Puccinia striiformis f. sp. tritici]KAI7950080.1 hypothetical protein MJO28_008901 [Puccinia striiformis f. sp. tritici]